VVQPVYCPHCGAQPYHSTVDCPKAPPMPPRRAPILPVGFVSVSEVHVRISDGAGLSQACRDAIEVACAVRGPVHFAFSGIPLTARESDTQDSLARAYDTKRYSTPPTNEDK